ncbi:DUF2207 domain-containing protein [Segetibacter sp. 3557_3]|uniref:DUF2207 domain-containing protein n=1 Tax=Segetibacter sp. 3557_3 TaxID=2547429 RepID=UPI001404381C|nr:DUF2207 domain-containing protein [Segetibacter sp. 3557_3]
MIKFVFATLLFFAVANSYAQEAFTISYYKVDVHVNKDGSLDIDETIDVNFTEQRHGILRFIPYKYEIKPLPSGSEQAAIQQKAGGNRYTMIENIDVEQHPFTVRNEGYYKVIQIGAEDKLVFGKQRYAVHYRILNSINLFSDHAELYFNIVGNKWNTTIKQVDFSVKLYEPLPAKPFSFVATGQEGSTENNTVSGWQNNQVFSGKTLKPLAPMEGVTIGVKMPLNYIVQKQYWIGQLAWLILPVLVFIGMYRLWLRKGKDEPVTVQVEYYPPENMCPGIAGYLIDTNLHSRDLTALVPYWGAGGYLKVVESNESKLFGLYSLKEYTFIKLKDLPADRMQFEKTLFNGIFAKGDQVPLSSLKNVLYKTMATASSELRSEVDKGEYYEKYSRGFAVLFVILGIITGVFAFLMATEAIWPMIGLPVALFASAVIMIVFGLFMAKKTKKGTLAYQQLAGFREFIKSVEKDRLAEFLKQDEHYFDKVLPYAIVFNLADKWKDKLEGINIPPPSWYSGNYSSYHAGSFMSNLNSSMTAMSSTFTSSPSSSGSSGGSFGGGGSSGGGSGGGGGSSW